MSDLQITPGDYSYHDGAVFIDTRQQVCCGNPQGQECCGDPAVEGDVEMFLEASDGDGIAIASALNVARQEGITASNLLDQRNDLLRSARALVALIEHPSVEHDETCPQIVAMKAVIAKAEGKQ